MAFLLLCVVWLSWGLSYPLAAIALRGFDVLTLRCAVQLLGALVLLLEAGLSGRSLAIEHAGWRDLAISGLLNMAAFPIGMTLGVYLMSPGRTSVLAYTMPIWATLFGRLMLGEALTAHRLIALALGLGAVIVMVSQDLSGLRDAPLGAALTLLAAFSFGLGTVYLKRGGWSADGSVVTFWQLLIGLVPMGLLWALSPPWSEPGPPGPAQWAALVFIGVMANAAANFAWFRVVRLFPAGISGIGALAVPCVGVASSAWLAQERLTMQDGVAMAMIAAALLCVFAEQFGRGAQTEPITAPSRSSRRGTG
ncbi:MAG: EamA family transporter [Alphaproteobacteria bacterium]|nr:EamA family transporter [Alphaproteobacteria bacterium]